jgi:hypothetical protein
MKWVSISALLLAVVFWSSAPNYQSQFSMPVFRLAGGFSLSLLVLAIAPFAISLIALRPHPLLSIPSITDRTPGSQSL